MTIFLNEGLIMVAHVTEQMQRPTSNCVRSRAQDGSLTTNLLEPVLRSSTLHEYRIIAAASHAPAEGNAHHRNTHMTPWGKWCTCDQQSCAQTCTPWILVETVQV